MTASMTAFTRKTTESQHGVINVDLRSVNHRYLELATRLPEFLRDQEKMIRDKVQKKINRGKVELTVNFQWGANLPYDFSINQPLLQKLAGASAAVIKLFPEAQMNVMDVLNWQGMLQIHDKQSQPINELLLGLIDRALEELIETRQREGEYLKVFIEERLNLMNSQLDLIRQWMPNTLLAERTRILNRFEELQITLDKDRLEQEMLWLVQKTDIAEELSRLNVHLAEVQRILTVGGVMGRRLDFLMQELNREVNTIASKSFDTDIVQASIEMKVLIEQMREQVQNIE